MPGKPAQGFTVTLNQILKNDNNIIIIIKMDVL